MKTRIRYFKTDDPNILKSGVVESKRGAKYVVYINIEKMEYRIKNLTRRVYVKQTTEREKKMIKTVLGAKKAAKRKLKELGVVFKLEMRL